ncbi:protein S100-P isoform X1 [Anomalospiza imberbis]|uniref:protein S100-P isoform X1 n=1 Tax=Anomalospiza imberbis TaxID=187417 RepID=UPI00358F8461
MIIISMKLLLTMCFGCLEAHSMERRCLEAWAMVPFLVAVGSLYLCYKKKKLSTLSGAAQIPVLTGRQEQEQRLEVEEIRRRNESTREAAEENSSSNSAEWSGKDKNAIDKVFKNLDENGDSQVDFKEFVIFVAALTCCCHKYFEQNAAK